MHHNLVCHGVSHTFLVQPRRYNTRLTCKVTGLDHTSSDQQRRYNTRSTSRVIKLPNKLAKTPTARKKYTRIGAVAQVIDHLAEVISREPEHAQAVELFEAAVVLVGHLPSLIVRSQPTEVRLGSISPAPSVVAETDSESESSSEPSHSEESIPAGSPVLTLSDRAALSVNRIEERDIWSGVLYRKTSNPDLPTPQWATEVTPHSLRQVNQWCALRLAVPVTRPSSWEDNLMVRADSQCKDIRKLEFLKDWEHRLEGLWENVNGIRHSARTLQPDNQLMESPLYLDTTFPLVPNPMHMWKEVEFLCWRSQQRLGRLVLPIGGTVHTPDGLFAYVIVRSLDTEFTVIIYDQQRLITGDSGHGQFDCTFSQEDLTDIQRRLIYSFMIKLRLPVPPVWKVYVVLDVNELSNSQHWPNDHQERFSMFFYQFAGEPLVWLPDALECRQQPENDQIFFWAYPLVLEGTQVQWELRETNRFVGPDLKQEDIKGERVEERL